jgi:S1-C subfamily serine protease
MKKENENNPLMALSEAMTEAVATAGRSTVLVNARRRFPASGVSFAPDLVLTADHVIEREDDITVGLPDGKELSASLAGRDPGCDLAVLRLSQPLAISAEPVSVEGRVGQLAIALGRPTPEGIQASLGIISAIGGPVRTGRGGLLERYLTTDATPYPGFSGGPLIDAGGRILGINTSGLVRGTSLAIPASLAWQTGEMLVKHGHIHRGYLGIRSQPVELPAVSQKALGRQQLTGLLLVGIEEDSPAVAGGLMIGDILVGLAGEPIADPDELLTKLTGDLVGNPTQVEVLRGGQPLSVTVIVGDRK